MSIGRWVLAIFISTFMTMIAIYTIKHFAVRYNIPVVREVAEGI